MLSYSLVPTFTPYKILEQFNKTGTEEPFSTFSDIPEYISVRLQQMRDLLPNWDGYDASSIDTRVLENSWDFLVQVPQQYLIEECLEEDSIAPAPHGTISFDWVNSSGDLLSVEVGATKLAYFAKFSDGKVELVEACPLPEIMPKIKKVFSKIYPK